MQFYPGIYIVQNTLTDKHFNRSMRWAHPPTKTNLLLNGSEVAGRWSVCKREGSLKMAHQRDGDESVFV